MPGAQTQLASVFTAVGIGLAALVLTPVLYYLPKATLAATIIVAVTSLIDWRPALAWRYSRADFAAVAATICVTLLAGVELGVVSRDHRVHRCCTCTRHRGRTSPLLVRCRARSTTATSSGTA
jgi:hypothetical protein